MFMFPFSKPHDCANGRALQPLLQCYAFHTVRIDLPCRERPHHLVIGARVQQPRDPLFRRMCRRHGARTHGRCSSSQNNVRTGVLCGRPRRHDVLLRVTWLIVHLYRKFGFGTFSEPRGAWHSACALRHAVSALRGPFCPAGKCFVAQCCGVPRHQFGCQ